MLEATYKKHTLHFNEPGGTSRGVLTSKDFWYLIIRPKDEAHVTGIGECSIIPGLSIDNLELFESKLQDVCSDIGNWAYWLEEGLLEFPAIRFGLETAIKDIVEGGNRILFPGDFTDGNDSIPINGLVWMGSFKEMRERIIEKIQGGYKCIKLKVGALNFEDELKLIKLIRNEFNENDIELRLDANGAFQKVDALDKLKRLSEYNIHSIEQPVRQKQWDLMADICEKSPIPIALDEELIGITDPNEISSMLVKISPQYIILKPSLVGGWRQSGTFIREAENRNIGWWITSALEGNIGLNAIAQWAYTLGNPMPQGLGTGQLFTNNFMSPLYIKEAKLGFDPKNNWNLETLINE